MKDSLNQKEVVVSVRNLRKSFGDLEVLRGVDIDIYKGENRLLIIPYVRHIAGFSVHSDWFKIINQVNNYKELGNSIFEAIRIIKESPLANNTPKEREANPTWKKASKYKGWKSFWKNNIYSYCELYETGEINVYVLERNEEQKGSYKDIIKEISLPSNATADEVGIAILEVLSIAESTDLNL